VKPGKNTVEIKVTNTWNNRLIGDERYPPDVPYVEPAKEAFSGTYGIKEMPQWFTNREQRPPSKRIAFSTWRIYTLDSPLQDAGVIGSVKIWF
jgi:hypothetical protein